jgi:hypothetical protein
VREWSRLGRNLPDYRTVYRWDAKFERGAAGKGRFCGVFEPRYQQKLLRRGKGANESPLHASPTNGYESGDFEQLVGGYFLGRAVVTYGRHD